MRMTHIVMMTTLVLFAFACDKPDKTYINAQIDNDLQTVENDYGIIKKNPKGKKFQIISQEEGEEGFEVVYEVTVQKSDGSEEILWRTMIFEHDGGVWRFKKAEDTPVM